MTGRSAATTAPTDIADPTRMILRGHEITS
jgi:hypothetical protein